jgi:hypothetical protein
MGLNSNFNNKWRNVFITEEKINNTSIKPGNFYKILVYKYVDGKTKSLSGPNMAYIFSLGKFSKDGKQYLASIKLKTIDPKIFFDDIQNILRTKPLTNEKVDEIYSNTNTNVNDEFSKLLKTISSDGRNIFSVFKTNNKMMMGYREYIIQSIKGVSYLDVSPDYLKIKLGKDSKKSKNIEKEKKLLDNKKETEMMKTKAEKTLLNNKIKRGDKLSKSEKNYIKKSETNLYGE